MKTSKYSVIFPAGKHRIIYNCRTDVMIQTDERLARLYAEHPTETERLEKTVPDFYHYLLEKELIVDDETDETATILDAWKKEDVESEELLVTINPTMNCNLRCWYCYEEHNRSTRMKPETIEAVTAFFKRQIESKRFKKIALSFFGGEPLLYFKQVVKPLLDRLKELLNDEITFMLHFTTNATLLTEDIISYLKPWNPSFQITLDGNEFIHNLVKNRGKGKPATYRPTLNNIQRLLQNRLAVGIRFNFTAKTLERFWDVLTDLGVFTEEEKKFCNVSFYRVWQDNGGDPEQLKKTLGELEKAFRAAGFFVVSQTSHVVGRCYADKENSMVINYDGLVYKCTAREFTPSKSEGTLSADGQIVWNERYRQRQEIRYGNAVCRSCILLSLCHGGCSQSKLEAEQGGCLKGYNDEQKMDFIRQRIKDLYVEQINRHQAEKKK